MSILRPVKLGVFFDQDVHSGGGYQQALNAARLVAKLPSDLVVPAFFTDRQKNVDTLRTHGLSAHLVPNTLVGRNLLKARRVVRHDRVLSLLRNVSGSNSFEKHFERHAIDLVYFLSPSIRAADLEELNYITTVWDLCHRDDLEFPEVRAGRAFEGRERLYRAILPKAVAILVDSPLSRINMTRRYGIDADRLHVMPFSPAAGTQVSDEGYEAGFVDIPGKYGLDVPYVFFPAQFWAHKNHVYLLEGLKCLEEQFRHEVGAILSGGDQGNLAHIKGVVAKLGLENRVCFPGFVANEEMPYLYKQSLALVMPTYFGPTNLPPLEAFSLGVPVLYPDKVGLRDQVGDGALLMDLGQPLSMATHLAALINDSELRTALVERGSAVMAQYSDQNRLETLTTVLREFQRRRACWA